MLGTLAKAVLNKGTWAALVQLRREVSSQRLHRASVRKARQYAGMADLRLHLGSGPNRKSDWINIDLYTAEADLRLDLRERFPFADGSAAHIYSEHVFEHFEFPLEVQHVLAESLRVLKAGGVFDVGVPDTEWPLRAYSEDEAEYFRLAREEFHPRWCDTRLHNINYHFRQGAEHKYAWDEETLTKVLVAAGFVDVVRREYDPGLDSEKRRVGTLYLVARKL
jgi:predicted SAM-dependent methyltransferase